MDLSGAQGELPMPMPMTMPMHAAASPYLGLHHDHHHHTGMNGRRMSPPTPTAAAAEEEEAEESKLHRALVPAVSAGAAAARYRECLKNHAAAIGGSATDGCGEFMPAGEDGSLDALRCSACGCHRNFHRKELDGHPAFRHHHHLLAAHHHRGGHGLMLAALQPPPTRMVMPLSAAMQTSESDDAARPAQQQRKRFRTKFTAEQKARMLGFAEDAGWRLQKLDDAAVQRFCQEVGVKRRVLKVWMHNNKHTLARRHHLAAATVAAADVSAPPHPDPGDPSLMSPTQQLRLE